MKHPWVFLFGILFLIGAVVFMVLFGHEYWNTMRKNEATKFYLIWLGVGILLIIVGIIMVMKGKGKNKL